MKQGALLFREMLTRYIKVCVLNQALCPGAPRLEELKICPKASRPRRLKSDGVKVLLLGLHININLVIRYRTLRTSASWRQLFSTALQQ